jgi:hypothetical protein
MEYLFWAFWATVAEEYRRAYPYLPWCDPMYDTMMPRLQ